MEDAMTTIAMTPPAHAGILAWIAGLTGTVALRVVNFVRAYLNRRDMQVLAGFDDRMLADIGLTRGDLRDAIAEPLWRDPSHMLVIRSRERRLARRRGPDQGAIRIVGAPSMIPDVEFALRTGRLTHVPRYH
jgi:uncharacterized protein YjiS (DUF1127 family)